MKSSAVMLRPLGNLAPGRRVNVIVPFFATFQDLNASGTTRETSAFVMSLFGLRGG